MYLTHNGNEFTFLKYNWEIYYKKKIAAKFKESETFNVSFLSQLN